MLARAAWACLLVGATVLAGCSGDSAQEPVTDVLDDQGLEAKEGKGVVVCVAVDEAIRPIANVKVTLTGSTGTLEDLTDAEGNCGFDGLEPGPYVLEAAKGGHTKVQRAVSVLADVVPDPIRLDMPSIPGEGVFPVQFKVEGMMECSIPGANLCFILNFYPCYVLGEAGQPCQQNFTEDSSIFFVHESWTSLNRTPDLMQLEVVWDPTLPAFEWMQMRVSAYTPGQLFVDPRQSNVVGPSPITMTFNRTTLEEWETGTETGFSVEAFASTNDQLCGPVPVVGCYGAAVQQRIDFYFTTFYGYLPPEGWTLYESGEVPSPP